MRFYAVWGLHIVLPGYATSSNVLRRPTAFRRSNPHENRTRTRPSTPRQRLQVPWLSSRLGSHILGPVPQMPDRNLAWCVLAGGNFIWRCPSRECLAQATPLNPRLTNPLASRQCPSSCASTMYQSLMLHISCEYHLDCCHDWFWSTT